VVAVTVTLGLRTLPGTVCENSSLTIPVEARLVAFSYVIRHTGRSPAGAAFLGVPLFHTGDTAGRLRNGIWMNQTRESLRYRRYTGRSPVSISFWAPPVRTGGAAGGSTSSVRASLDLSPRNIVVIPVEARLTKTFLSALLLSILRSTARGLRNGVRRARPKYPCSLGPHQ
jgi:hypothetical protein